MKLKNFILFYFFLTLPHAANTSDSMIHGPPYRDILLSLEKVANDYSDFADVIEFGKSAGGLPLKLIKIYKKENFVAKNPGAPAIYISDSIHGYEYLNIGDRLPHWVLRNALSDAVVANFLGAGGVIYINPIANPDGYEKRQRKNAGDVDLNRDFELLPLGEKNTTQPETQTLLRYLENDLQKNNLKLKFALNYHCCGRFDRKDQAQLGYPWAYTTNSIPENDLNEHKAVAQEIEKAFQNTDIISGSWSVMMEYEAKGTAEDYFYAKHGALSYVFEGLEAKEHLRFDHHISMWKFVLGYLLPPRTQP